MVCNLFAFLVRFGRSQRHLLSKPDRIYFMEAVNNHVALKSTAGIRWNAMLQPTPHTPLRTLLSLRLCAVDLLNLSVLALITCLAYRV